eukprot:6938284-Prorocentrum_lima.AAC.1
MVQRGRTCCSLLHRACGFSKQHQQLLLMHVQRKAHVLLVDSAAPARGRFTPLLLPNNPPGPPHPSRGPDHHGCVPPAAPMQGNASSHTRQDPSAAPWPPFPPFPAPKP